MACTIMIVFRACLLTAAVENSLLHHMLMSNILLCLCVNFGVFNAVKLAGDWYSLSVCKARDFAEMDLNVWETDI